MAIIVLRTLGVKNLYAIDSNLARLKTDHGDWGTARSAAVLGRQECYAKNPRIQFGRCSARAVFQSALNMLVEIQDELVNFVEVWEGLEDAPKGYELFDKGQIRKIAFQLSSGEVG